MIRAMSADAVAVEATELLRTLIRNACVNDGDPGSGQEVRQVDALEDYFAGSGLDCERYSAGPGRVSLITRISRAATGRRRPSSSWATPTWCP
jgi:acetylornithine deacetylase/succinyl-diaminopimelate desuccinylase-like protein